jgi:hypothetical protein
MTPEQTAQINEARTHLQAASKLLYELNETGMATLFHPGSFDWQLFQSARVDIDDCDFRMEKLAK